MISKIAANFLKLHESKIIVPEEDIQLLYFIHVLFDDLEKKI